MVNGTSRISVFCWNFQSHIARNTKHAGHKSDFCFTNTPSLFSNNNNIIIPKCFEKAVITVPESVHAHGPITVHFKLTNQHASPLTICKRNTPLDSVENKIYHIKALEARLVPLFLGFGRAKSGMRL